VQTERKPEAVSFANFYQPAALLKEITSVLGFGHKNDFFGKYVVFMGKIK
jgi:hypothetical protein